MLCLKERVYPIPDDVQRRPPVGACARCGNELYWYDKGELCQMCRAELEGEDG